MTSLIKIEKAPYIVGLILAAVTWSITHLVDRILQSPTIEYCESNRKLDAESGEYSVMVRNITNTRLFENIQFLFVIGQHPNAKIVGAQIIPLGASNEGDEPPDYTSGESANFTIKQFQPNAAFKLVAKYTGTNRPVFKLAQVSNNNNNENTVRLIKSSLETYIVKNEFVILSIIITLGSVLIIALLWFQSVDFLFNNNKKD